MGGIAKIYPAHFFAVISISTCTFSILPSTTLLSAAQFLRKEK